MLSRNNQMKVKPNHIFIMPLHLSPHIRWGNILSSIVICCCQIRDRDEDKITELYPAIQMNFYTINCVNLPSWLGEIIIECDCLVRGVWFQPLSKLRQIHRNLHWEVCRCVFLNKCYPENLVAWSSNSRDPACAELDLVFHWSAQKDCLMYNKLWVMFN
jgi:hypothetical protein